MPSKKYVPPDMSTEELIRVAYQAVARLAKRFGVQPMTLDQFQAEHARQVADHVRAQADEKSKN